MEEEEIGGAHDEEGGPLNRVENDVGVGEDTQELIFEETEILGN